MVTELFALVEQVVDGAEPQMMDSVQKEKYLQRHVADGLGRNWLLPLTLLHRRMRQCPQL